MDEHKALAWNGDYGRADREPKRSTVVALADVVGDALGVGDGTLLPLGAVIDLVDLAAGRCAHSFMEGPTVTVSVDRGRLSSPIRRGDLVQCDARVVDVGSSSITVQVVTKREDVSRVAAGEKPQFLECFTAQLTFVAVDMATGRPKKNVPRLLDDDPDVAARSAAARAEKDAVREMDALLRRIDEDLMDSLPALEDADPYAEMRTGRRTIDETRIELRKQYLPRHENFGGIVFGGDLLMLLERAALYCAKRHCGNPRASCVHMHGVHFRLPIQPTYLLRSVARVVKVQKYTMEVEVTVSVDRQHEGRPLEVSHVGYFSIISHDARGHALPVRFGLDVANSSKDARRAYAKASVRLDRLPSRIVNEETLVNLFAGPKDTAN